MQVPPKMKRTYVRGEFFPVLFCVLLLMMFLLDFSTEEALCFHSFPPSTFTRSLAFMCGDDWGMFDQLPRGRTFGVTWMWILRCSSICLGFTRFLWVLLEFLSADRTFEFRSRFGVPYQGYPSRVSFVLSFGLTLWLFLVYPRDTLGYISAYHSTHLSLGYPSLG